MMILLKPSSYIAVVSVIDAGITGGSFISGITIGVSGGHKIKVSATRPFMRMAPSLRETMFGGGMHSPSMKTMVFVRTKSVFSPRGLSSKNMLSALTHEQNAIKNKILIYIFFMFSLSIGMKAGCTNPYLLFLGLTMILF